MARLVVPKFHKDWLYPIIKPVDEVPVIDFVDEEITIISKVFSDNICKVFKDKVIRARLEDGGYYDQIKSGRFSFKNVGIDIDRFVKINDVYYHPDCVITVTVDDVLYMFPTWNPPFELKYCSRCRQWMRRFEGNVCAICARKIQRISYKGDPGWHELARRLESEDDSVTMFGIEFEVCISRDNTSKEVQQILVDQISDCRYRAQLAHPNLELPEIVWVTDSSLHHRGVELNFAPVSLAFFKKNEDIFVDMVNNMKDLGLCAHKSDGTEVAGIHIHVSNCFDASNVFLISTWFDRNAVFHRTLGMREEHVYNNYCGLNSSRDMVNVDRNNTVEYRCISSQAILDRPLRMKYYMEWAELLASTSKDPIQLGLTVRELCAMNNKSHLIDEFMSYIVDNAHIDARYPNKELIDKIWGREKNIAMNAFKNMLSNHSYISMNETVMIHPSYYDRNMLFGYVEDVNDYKLVDQYMMYDINTDFKIMDCYRTVNKEKSAELMKHVHRFLRIMSSTDNFEHPSIEIKNGYVFLKDTSSNIETISSDEAIYAA